MSKSLLPSVLFALALASMAWSNAAHSALSCLAALAVVVIAPRDFAERLPQYSKYVAMMIVLVLIGYALAEDRDRAYNDIKGTWPLAHLFVVPIAVCSKSRHAFITTFMYIGGLAAAYSALQYFSLLDRSNFQHQGGHYVATSHIWAFCVSMTTLVAVSFDSFLRKSHVPEKIQALVICTLALFALWINQERANFLLAILCMGSIPILHQDYTRRAKLYIISSIPVILVIAVAFAGPKLALLGGIFSDPEAALNSIRTAHWQAAYDGFLSAPWFGHGLGSYPALAMEHHVHGEYLTSYVRDQGHIWCHNMPLQLLATTGIAGTSIAAFVAYKITAPLFSVIKAHNQAAVIGLCACLIHFGASVTDTPSLHSLRLAAFTILIGFAYGVQKNR